MIITNRYDALQAKAKKLRNKTERRTKKCKEKQERNDAKINDLRKKNTEISYKCNVYCKKIGLKLKDVNSLIANEQERICADKIEADYNKATYDGKVKK